MKSRTIFAATVLSGLVFAGQNARAQAHVNEVESATLYVDATHGSDSAAGTLTSPLKSISAAASVARRVWMDNTPSICNASKC